MSLPKVARNTMIAGAMTGAAALIVPSGGGETAPVQEPRAEAAPPEDFQPHTGNIRLPGLELLLPDMDRPVATTDQPEAPEHTADERPLPNPTPEHKPDEQEPEVIAQPITTTTIAITPAPPQRPPVQAPEIEPDAPPITHEDNPLLNEGVDSPVTDPDNPLLNEDSIYPRVELNTEIPSSVEQFMRSETVRMFDGCSGFLIRDESNKPIGAVSAKHCLSKDLETITSGDETYAITPKSMDVFQGESADMLRKIGSVGSIYVSEGPGFAEDLAIAVFEGEDPAEALSNYQSLSIEEIQSLKPGDRMYLSGWPADQDNNPGFQRRQSFPLTILGTGNSKSDGNIKLWAAVESNADGAECSFGNSGGEGFVAQKSLNANGSERINIRSVGVLSSFSDFAGDTFGTPEGGAISRQRFENTYGIYLPDNVVAVCGFSPQIPSPENGGILVKPARSSEEIPGYENPESILIEAARNHFYDPDAEKIIVDAYLAIGGGKDTVSVIDSFYLYRDEKTGKAVVGSVAQKGPGDNLWLDINFDLSILNVLDKDSVPGIQIHKVTGLLSLDENGSFADQTGTIRMGERKIVAHDELGDPYILYVDDSGNIQAEVNNEGVHIDAKTA